MAAYGDLTPREMLLIVDDYNDRRQHAREDMLTSAYLTAYWQRVKKLPSLKRVLEDDRPKTPQQPQTVEQMLAAVKSLYAKLEKGEV